MVDFGNGIRTTCCADEDCERLDDHGVWRDCPLGDISVGDYFWVGLSSGDSDEVESLSIWGRADKDAKPCDNGWMLTYRDSLDCEMERIQELKDDVFNKVCCSSPDPKTSTVQNGALMTHCDHCGTFVIDEMIYGVDKREKNVHASPNAGQVDSQLQHCNRSHLE